MPQSPVPDAPDNAEALFEAFDWAGAEAALTRRTEQRPATPDELWLLAVSQRRQRRFEPAVSSFTRFLSAAGHDPRAEEAHSERLHCTRKLQHYEEAERLGREAAGAFP